MVTSRIFARGLWVHVDLLQRLMSNEQLTSQQAAVLIQIFLTEGRTAACIYLASYRYLLQGRIKHVDCTSCIECEQELCTGNGFNR